MIGSSAASPSTLAPPRRQWRAYLLLSRVSNLPTVWTNVLAGLCASTAALAADTFLQVAVAASLFYMGGMFLNDAFDAASDGQERPERPIPSGDVSRAEAFTAGFMFLGAGELLLAPQPGALALGAVLAGAIVLYDYCHKRSRLSPIIMGICRGLVYVIAAASAAGLTTVAVVGAGVVASYVAGLTVVARLAGRNARWLIPLLIAGISLIDAVFIAIVSPSPLLAVAAACGIPLTLFLQRFVPGD